eukprot:gene6751-3424_t
MDSIIHGYKESMNELGVNELNESYLTYTSQPSIWEPESALSLRQIFLWEPESALPLRQVTLSPALEQGGQRGTSFLPRFPPAPPLLFKLQPQLLFYALCHCMVPPSRAVWFIRVLYAHWIKASSMGACGLATTPDASSHGGASSWSQAGLQGGAGPPTGSGGPLSSAAPLAAGGCGEQEQQRGQETRPTPKLYAPYGPSTSAPVSDRAGLYMQPRDRLPIASDSRPRWLDARDDQEDASKIRALELNQKALMEVMELRGRVNDLEKEIASGAATPIPVSKEVLKKELVKEKVVVSGVQAGLSGWAVEEGVSRLQQLDKDESVRESGLWWWAVEQQKDLLRNVVGRGARSDADEDEEEDEEGGDGGGKSKKPASFWDFVKP